LDLWSLVCISATVLEVLIASGFSGQLWTHWTFMWLLELENICLSKFKKKKKKGFLPPSS